MSDKDNIGLDELVEQFDLDRTNPKIEAFLTALKTRDSEVEGRVEEARKKARYDGLTGLERKENLYPFLDRNVARADRNTENLSILMIDADNFKQYNDSYGHLQGDEALKTLGSIVKGRVRKEDLPVRYGGEEICVVLPETDAEGLERIAEEIRESIENTQIPKAVKGKEIDEDYKHMTVSMGGFTYNPSLNAVLGFLNMEDEDKVKTLIEKADEALYEAKNSGKNRYCVVELE